MRYAPRCLAKDRAMHAHAPVSIRSSHVHAVSPAEFDSSMSPAVETTTSRSKVEAAGRLPSMECEPKTLTLDQIKFAREAALYVMNTKSEEEAIRIFTEGLKPVQVKTVRKSNSFDSSSDDEVELGGSSDGAARGCSSGGCRASSKGGGARAGGHHRGCCCRRRRSSSIERDIATAPF